ncbi:hypothetical protein MRX96_054983 [Rhipicephalus microplus]
MAQAPCLLSLFIWIATYAAAPAESLRVIELKAPVSPIRGYTVTLECSYDLERDQLYSVKWFKDGIEFLRYVPNDRPRIQVFTIKGLGVDVASSNDTTAVLDDVQHSASGNYSCEVSTEAPTFDMGVAEKRLVVAETPISIDQPPIGILGGSVRLNCHREKMFNVQGVTVDRLQRNYSSLYLKNLSALSAGAYRCEASSDAPPFSRSKMRKCSR